MKNILKILKDNKFYIIFFIVLFFILNFTFRKNIKINLENEIKEEKIKIRTSEKYKETKKYLEEYFHGDLYPTNNFNAIKCLIPKINIKHKGNKSKVKIEFVNLSDVDIENYKFLYKVKSNDEVVNLFEIDDLIKSGEKCIKEYTIDGKLDTKDIIPLLNVATIRKYNVKISYIYDYELKEYYRHYD